MRIEIREWKSGYGWNRTRASARSHATNKQPNMRTRNNGRENTRPGHDDKRKYDGSSSPPAPCNPPKAGRGNHGGNTHDSAHDVWCVRDTQAEWKVSDTIGLGGRRALLCVAFLHLSQ